MKSRVLFATLLLLILSIIPGHAQSVRVVRGMISDASGNPLKEVKIITPDGDEFPLTDAGQFEIRISTQVRVLTFSAPFYRDVQKAVDGTYMQVVMTYDTSALPKEEKERLEADAKARTQAGRQEKEAAYNEKYFNKGLAHSVRVSYAYQLAKCETAYTYSGWRSYGPLHPFSLDYTLSYKINRIFSVGIGAGILFDAKSITIVGDKFICPNFKERRLDLPVFATAAAYFGRWKVRPTIALSAGYYTFSRVILAEGMLGMEFRLGRRPSVEVGALVKTSPYPSFDMEQKTGKYKMAISPGAALRFNL